MVRCCQGQKVNGQVKVLLVNPPRYTKYAQPPMGLALLAAILEKEGYGVSIVDMNLSPFPLRAIDCISFDADVVGITAMTPTISSALTVARHVRRVCPEVFMMLGGVHATLMPTEVKSAAPEIDAIVCGEGDNAIVEIARNRKKGIWLCENRLDMDSLPFLAYHLLPISKYRPHPPHGRALPFLPMLTSRGCSYHCSYCSKAVFGSRFRAQSPSRVLDEVVYYIYRHGVREIAFYDDVFTLDKKRAYAICEEMLRRNVKLCWTCETRVNLVDADLLGQMKKAGCYSVSYGIESASQDVLDVIDKGITKEQCEYAVALTRQAGIQTVGYFMLGSPNETPRTIRQTIDFAKRLRLDYAQFSVTTPFPGTKLWEYYRDGRENAEMPTWDSFVYAGVGNKTSPVFESNELSRGDIERWVSSAYREFYLRASYVWQRMMGVRSMGDVRVLLEGLKMLGGM